MIYYEVIEDEDVGDGYSTVLRFKSQDNAWKYVDEHEGCLDGVATIDTDSKDFFEDE